MKIATFNVNDINKRLGNLLAWLAGAKPDVVCLQELKAEQGAFPAQALRNQGHEAVWEGERSWNGVAILARNHAPVLTCASLPGSLEDHQARYIEAAVQGVLITSIVDLIFRNDICQAHGSAIGNARQDQQQTIAAQSCGRASAV